MKNMKTELTGTKLCWRLRLSILRRS